MPEQVFKINAPPREHTIPKRGLSPNGGGAASPAPAVKPRGVPVVNTRPGYERLDDGTSAFGSFRRVLDGSTPQARSGSALRGARGAADRLAGMGMGLMGRYNRMYAPVHQDIIDLARQRPDWMVNEAATDVGIAFDKSRGIMNRNASRMGVNPNSGRFAGLQQQWALARAAAEAGAKTRARRRANDVQLDNLMRAAGLGSQFPGLALNAQRSAVNAYRGVASDYGDIAHGQGALHSYKLQDEIDQDTGGLG